MEGTDEARRLQTDVRGKLVIAAYELNMLIRDAVRVGLRVSVDSVERAGYTEVVVSARGGEEGPEVTS